MRLLFDHNVPATLRPLLTGFNVVLAEECGWDRLTNGALLAAAEEAGFAVLVTVDRRMRYQQNLAGRRIGLAVLPTQHLPTLQAGLTEVLAVIAAAGQGGYAGTGATAPAAEASAATSCRLATIGLFSGFQHRSAYCGTSCSSAPHFVLMRNNLPHLVRWARAAADAE